MIKDYNFNKKRILLGTFSFLFMLFLSIYLVLEPEKFIRNIFMKEEPIQILGIIGIIFFSTLFYSFIKLFSRKIALQITEEYLLDNSKYEALGQIEWKNITKVKRIKKYSIEFFVNESIFKDKNISLLKKALLFMQNWNYKKSIIISSALLDCSIEELFDNITLAYKNYKKTTHNS